MSDLDDPDTRVRSHRTATSEKMLVAVLAKRLNLENDTVASVVSELQTLIHQLAQEGGRVRLENLGIFELSPQSTKRLNFTYRPKP